MRKTVVLSLDDELAYFMQSQQGMVDPSAFINKLLEDEIERQNVTVDGRLVQRLENDEILQAVELMMDESTPVAD